MNVSIGKRWEEFVEGVVQEGRTARRARWCVKASAWSRSVRRSWRALRQTIEASIAEGGARSREEVSAALSAKARALAKRRAAVRRLVYLAAAERDLLSILEYIARESGSAAIGLAFTERFQGQCARLASLPGTLGRARPELRSFPFGNYVIFFATATTCWRSSTSRRPPGHRCLLQRGRAAGGIGRPQGRRRDCVSFSPRSTIRRAPSGSGRCSAFASLHGAESQVFHPTARSGSPASPSGGPRGPRRSASWSETEQVRRHRPLLYLPRAGPGRPQPGEEGDRAAPVEGEPHRRPRAVCQRLVLSERGEGHETAVLGPEP